MNVASLGLQVKSEMALGRCSTPKMLSMKASNEENANALWVAPVVVVVGRWTRGER